jgi:hypothetical protein
VSFFFSKENRIRKINRPSKNHGKNIKVLKEQEKKTSENLQKIIKKEDFFISNLKWFSKLEQSLYQNYFINIREDIQGFSQLKEWTNRGIKKV